VHRFTGIQAYRYTAIQVYGRTGIRAYRYTGITGIQAHRYTGKQVRLHLFGVRPYSLAAGQDVGDECRRYLSSVGSGRYGGPLMHSERTQDPLRRDFSHHGHHTPRSWFAAQLRGAGTACRICRVPRQRLLHTTVIRLLC